MTGARSAAAVLRAVGCPHLALYKGEGYWYFIYDDVAGVNSYDSYSVMTMRLNDMSLERWAAIGRAFAADVAKGEFTASSYY